MESKEEEGINTVTPVAAEPDVRPLSNTPLYALLKLQYSNDSEDEELFKAYKESMKSIEEEREEQELAAVATTSKNKENPLPTTTSTRGPSAFQPVESPMVVRPPSATAMTNFAYTTPPMAGPQRVTPHQWNGLLGYPMISTPSDPNNGGRNSAPPTIYTQPRPMLPTRAAAPIPAVARPIPPPPQPRKAAVATTKKKAPSASVAAPRKKAAPKAAARGRSEDADDEDEDVEEAEEEEVDADCMNQSTKFRDFELDALMDIIKEVLPIGKFEWDKVATRFNAMFPTRPRLMRNLRNRFNNYAGKKPPTGDPDCPPLVRKAKQVNQLIKSKAGMKILKNNGQGAAGDGTGASLGAVALSKTNADVVVQPKKSRVEKSAASNGDRFLQAFLVSEKMQAKRDAKEEKMLAKRAAKEERMRHEERQETMKLLMGTMTSLAAAFTGKSVEIPTMQLPAARRTTPSSGGCSSSSSSTSSSEDSSDSSVSTIDSSSDGGNGNKKRKRFNDKMKKLRRKQKKLAKAFNKKSPGKDGSPKGGLKKGDDDDSGSEYEVNARDFYAGGSSRGII
jgi:hypothetical protein